MQGETSGGTHTSPQAIEERSPTRVRPPQTLTLGSTAKTPTLTLAGKFPSPEATVAVWSRFTGRLHVPCGRGPVVSL